MLAEVTFVNFKSFREATLKLAPLTLLIGANAAGKSNAIEGLRLLSWLAQDHKLSSIGYVVQGADDLIRGAASDLPYRGENGFGFRYRLAGVDWPDGELLIALESEELRVVQERIQASGAKVPLYEIKQAASGSSHDIRVAYDNFSRGRNKPLIVCTDQQLVMLQLVSAARFDTGHKKAAKVIPDICARYITALADILFLDPAPRVMRGYSHIGEKRLRGDGQNLSGILYGICLDPVGREAVLRFIKSLPEQNIARIQFPEPTHRQEVMVQLVEAFGGKEQAIDAPLLSDGTLRVLAVAAALLSAPEGSMVVVEEIDNGVHPSRARQLLASIREVAERRRLRVLLTTHNPALMDALPDAALGDAVFCWRDPEVGDSRLKRLADLDRAPSLLAQGSLGDLVTQGVLDRFVKTKPLTAEEWAERSRRWLEELEQEPG